MVKAFGVDFFFESFMKVFLATSPLAAIALYLNMTPHYSWKDRVATARVGCVVGWLVMMFFAITGRWFFGALGIGVNSFSIASGLLLMTVGFGMLRGKDPMENDQADLGANGVVRRKADIAITPLGVPIIAGPCAVMVAIGECNDASGLMQSVACLLAITCVMYCMYWIFKATAKGASWLTPTVLRLGYKLSGLFMVALGVQLIMNGINGARIEKLKARDIVVGQYVASNS